MVPEFKPDERLLRLLDQKKRIEQEINEFGEILRKNGNVGMNQPLVDADDYPRNDIDIIQVRHARNRINCLQNDLKALTKQIEAGLEKHFRDLNSVLVNNNARVYTPTVSEERRNVDIEMQLSPEEIRQLKAFAWISDCRLDSPAFECGLRSNDQIIEFGSVNASNFRDLFQIADIVKHSENRSINVKIRRNNEHLHDYELVPKKWSGRGLLGCNILLT